MARLLQKSEPVVLNFADDGVVPNNPLPVVIYRDAFDLGDDPEAAIERVFASHDWHDMWRNGIYDFPHYHSMIHEALAVARGRARIRLGGDDGKELEIFAGDAAILPAGTAHQCLWASADFAVVGAYPKSGGTYNLIRPTKAHHAKAIETIPKVPMPNSDPVYGKEGTLLKLWACRA